MDKSEISHLPEDLYINLHTTSRCNLACKYCYDERKEHPHDPSYTLESLTEFLLRAGCRCPTVIFFGGEPLCNVSFIQMAMEVFESQPAFSSVHFQIQTNGTLLRVFPWTHSGSANYFMCRSTGLNTP
jgi:sulfatase maturation enzyme AslB (radical SAM superfamily)